MAEHYDKLFSDAPVWTAVLALVVPTVAGQLITVAYNMADTFFIGQTGDPNQVAAASLFIPLMFVLTALANLLGIGGSSLMSRSLGAGDPGRAGRVSSFSIWSSIVIALVYGIVVYVTAPALLPAVGADSETYGFCLSYVLWTVSVGAVPTVLAMTLSHLVRAEGLSKHSSAGIMLGGVANILLDPVFIFTLDMGIEGAAIATMLSNVLSVAYFLVLLYVRGRSTALRLCPDPSGFRDGIPREVVLVGLPSCMMTLMSVLSNAVLNTLMVSYGNKAMAGVGIAKRIDMVTFAVSTGLSQGVLPLIGYNYASENRERLMSVVKASYTLCLGVAIVSTFVLVVFAGPIVGAFIDDPVTVGYGEGFQRIICMAGPCIAVTAMSIAVLQAVGEKRRSFVLSMLRKGCLDIPLMLILNIVVGVYGIVWAAPAADFGAMVVSLILFIPFWRRLVASLEKGSGVPSLVED